MALAGIPPELEVPIFLNSYPHKAVVTVNYGARQSGVIVEAEINSSKLINSGESVTLSKVGQNEARFIGTRPDGSQVISTQMFNVQMPP